MRSTKPLAIAIAIAILTLASCGTSNKTATPAAPSISLALATTGPATTVPPASVAPPTAPPTTVAPTTTTMSLQDLEKVVRARFLEIEGPQVERCLANPVACDPTVFAAKEGPLRPFLAKSVGTLVEHKWIARQLLDDPSYTVVESITFDAIRTRATVVSCKWDTAVVVQPAAAPDGSDIIVNDLKNSYNHEWSMVLENRTWLMSDKRVVTKHEGVNACPPRG